MYRIVQPSGPQILMLEDAMLVPYFVITTDKPGQ